jgi:hypothetical protein
MAQPTPTPWETDGRAVRSSGPCGRQLCIFSASVNGRPFDETYDEAAANAAFTVRAVNSHDQLLAALKEAKSMLRVVSLDEEGDYEYRNSWRKGVAKIDAAIAAASPTTEESERM